MKKISFISVILISVVLWAGNSFAFWVWTPKSKFPINPKYAVKDTPREQYNWAMYFFKQNDFQRAADEFLRLVQYYPDSEFAPESQYYAGRSYQELGKYYFAFQNYQKTVEKYPFTKRMDDIIKREYNIAGIFQDKESPKLMDIELSVSLERAIEIYKKIVANNPFGKYSDKALFSMAGCYRRTRKYSDAEDAYEKIVTDYPESSLAPEAKYQLAYTKYEASLDPEYDQGSTDQALKDFKNILNTTSVPSVAKEANEVLGKLRERKAASEINVAKFYEKRKKYSSAVYYYKKIEGKFKGTKAAGYAEERISALQKKIKK